MMLNSKNNAFEGIFIPLYHSFGFPNMILEGGLLNPMSLLGSGNCFVRIEHFKMEGLPTYICTFSDLIQSIIRDLKLKMLSSDAILSRTSTHPPISMKE